MVKAAKRRRTATAAGQDAAAAAAPSGAEAVSEVEGAGAAQDDIAKIQREIARQESMLEEEPSALAEGGEGAPRRKKKAARADSKKASTAQEAGEESIVAAPVEDGVGGLQDLDDKKGILHLATIPSAMGVGKVRHLMEQFGPVGRIYLAPEDAAETRQRKKTGGNKKQRFTEGWVEFLDRRLAKRVALSLNGTPIGGKKRHNYYRDDIWNMKYLPKFKWHQLKEGAIYNKQVRKARLEQKVSQARRENDFFLERVQKAKVEKRIDEKRASKGRVQERKPVEAKAPRVREDKSKKAVISDRVLDSLFM